ncbi:helix-turn-helix transcriptional regulator [Murimonas intestini]|uniref:helix-turn-helix transcriptional regulator n=1 Tax=Murimonas intestini TaxID=1337051 RepID=UPI0011DE24F1|nr:AraC family transcriptional regulator [Murimonas intestini]
MEYITIATPPYPFFIYSGDALYRPGDFHRRRSGLGCFDLLFVEKGELFMTDGPFSYHLKKNDMLILHPDRTHWGHKPCQTTSYFHWLHFYSTESYEYTDTISRNPQLPGREFRFYRVATSTLLLPSQMHFSEPDASKFISLLQSLESLSINRYQQSAMVEKKLVNNNALQNQLLFAELLMMLNLSKEVSGGNEIASLAMQYLKSHYAREISLAEVAAAVNCHSSHLIRCFKKAYQMTPNEMLNSIRMQQAKMLLESSGLSCSEIAAQTGYSSASYFSKLFKKHFGMSPQEYRNNN